ncbi:MAG: Hsp70 family protein [Muribaculaceae bacterium]|nr:Hsp70 family protein [Muribaculaceae bacterium]
MAKIFGIDLGTTFSCIAYVDEYGKPVVIPNRENSPVTPSVVFFETADNVSVGEIAKQALQSDPDLVCTTIKRQMGNQDYTFYANDKEYKPETVSALILGKLAKDAAEKLGEPVENVVITCPAYFGLDEREATRKAGEIAGLNVLSIINEPTAAAISYGLDVTTPQTVMVYDLGGGTFDVTIIKVSNGVIEVVATGGDHHLGGKDWDQAIRDYFVDQYCAENGTTRDDVTANFELMADLEVKCEQAKVQLSERESTKLKAEGFRVELSREQFESLTRNLLENTIQKTNETMAEAQRKGVDKYDKILLVGGSTRMPQVMKILQETYPQIPIEFCDPDAAVAKGAAIFGVNMAAYPEAREAAGEAAPVVDAATQQAAEEITKTWGIGSGQQGPMVIRNVISKSIALELVDDDGQDKLFNQIFKNTAIPHTHTLRAGTIVDNQTQVHLAIFENDYAAGAVPGDIVPRDDAKLLTDGDMGPLPSGLPKGTLIEIDLKIDDQGLLAIDARHPESGVTKHLEVLLQNVMSEEQLNEAKEQVKGISIL